MLTDELPTILLPREREQFFAHPAKEDALNQQWDARKFHHTQLFCGPKGIGKATLAFRFARMILVGKSEPEPAGLFGDALPAGINFSHPASRRISNGSHPDLLVVETGFDEKRGKERKEITIDESRKIHEFLSLTPAEADWRVVIIDSVDDLNRNAANAVLKILEEPPARAVLFLISHNPGMLLPTIRSRCHAVKFAMPDEQSFRDILALSAPELSSYDLTRLYHYSYGSPGFAVEAVAAQGLRLVSELYAILAASPVKINDKLRYISDMVANDNQHNWNMVRHAIKWVMTQIMAYNSGLALDFEVVDGERGFVQKIAERKPQEAWFELNDWITSLFSDTDRLNLERKATVLNIITALE